MGSQDEGAPARGCGAADGRARMERHAAGRTRPNRHAAEHARERASALTSAQLAATREWQRTQTGARPN